MKYRTKLHFKRGENIYVWKAAVDHNTNCKPFLLALTGNADKMLSDFGIANGSRLKADDFLQNYNIVINIAHV